MKSEGLLRVALDVAFIQLLEGRPRSGIARVIEELLPRLLDRPELDLRLTGLCGLDRAAAAASVRLLAKGLPGPVGYDAGFRSKTGLSSVESRLLPAVFRAAQAIAPSPGSVLRRGLRLSLRVTGKILAADTEFDLDGSRLDVLHSTYLPLPPRKFTGSIARVLTVYDLIPVRAPELVPPELTAQFERTLASLDVERDHVIAISEFTKQELCERTRMAPERVTVAPLAPAPWFQPPTTAEVRRVRQIHSLADEPYVFCLASLEPRKNFRLVFDAFVELVNARPELPLRLFAAGLSRADAEPLLIDCPRRALERMHFPGAVPDSDLRGLYGGAACFAYPSLYEGFGLPVLEAMACGTPTITARTSSLPEVAGDAAVLVDPEDVEALADAMLRLGEDAAARQSLSQAGLSRAAEFSWDRCAGLTVGVYQRAREEQRG